MMKKLLAFLLFFITLGITPAFAAPATLNPTADAYVYSTSPTSNYGSATFLRSGFWVEFRQKFISLLKFDLSSIPDDAVIASAQLKLYVSSGGSSGVMTAARNTEDWTESSVNWSTRPSTDDPRASALVSSGASYIPWDVTELVQDWFNGDHTNYGFSIVATAQETDFSADFHSKEASGSQPELIVYYDRPLPTPTPTSTPKPQPEADRPLDETPPTTPSEPIPDRQTVVEEETPSSDDEPLVISPSTPSATASAASVPARAATPSAQPTSMLVRAFQIVLVVSGLLLFGVAGYVVYKEVKRRRAQEEQKIGDQNVDQGTQHPSKETPNQD